jgi:hypothetical protein
MITNKSVKTTNTMKQHRTNRPTGHVKQATAAVACLPAPRAQASASLLFTSLLVDSTAFFAMKFRETNNSTSAQRALHSLYYFSPINSASSSLTYALFTAMAALGRRASPPLVGVAFTLCRY